MGACSYLVLGEPISSRAYPSESDKVWNFKKSISAVTNYNAVVVLVLLLILKGKKKRGSEGTYKNCKKVFELQSKAKKN